MFTLSNTLYYILYIILVVAAIALMTPTILKGLKNLREWAKEGEEDGETQRHGKSQNP